jgi:type IV pilus assembly protein PilO
MNLSELSDLDFSDIGSWPAIAKGAVLLLIVAAVLAAGFYFDTKDMRVQLAAVEAEEQKLLKEFHKRQRVIANLEAYRAQLAEMEKSLESMLRQLPTRTEMPDLLEDISNTGLINGLVFDRFKPESERPKEFYATQPISIRARGTYHQFGAFLSGVSALPRIVTVGNLKISGKKSGEGDGEREKRGEELVLEASLNTYRYLDEDEETGR